MDGRMGWLSLEGAIYRAPTVLINIKQANMHGGSSEMIYYGPKETGFNDPFARGLGLSSPTAPVSMKN